MGMIPKKLFVDNHRFNEKEVLLGGLILPEKQENCEVHNLRSQLQTRPHQGYLYIG